MSTRDLSKLTVVQLREQLRSRGLSADGTKAVLVERLKGSYAAEDTILNSDANASKESLEETVLEGAINEDDILGPDTSVKKKEEPSPVPAGVAAPAAAENKIAHELAKNQKKDSGDETLDAKMKRAQRFGLPLSDEQLKLKRAERFGMQSTAAAGATESLEERKRKRAERSDGGQAGAHSKGHDISYLRFGIDNKAGKVVSIGGVEKAPLEVLERRAKRFGLCSDEAELEIKKQKRAERFGLNNN